VKQNIQHKETENVS